MLVPSLSASALAETYLVGLFFFLICRFVFFSAQLVLFHCRPVEQVINKNRMSGMVFMFTFDPGAQEAEAEVSL